MKENNRSAVLADCLKKNRALLILFGILNGLNLITFWLYDLNLESFVYSLILATSALLVYLLLFYLTSLRRNRERKRLLCSILSDWNCPLTAGSLAEKDYQQMIRILGENAQKAATEFENERRDMLDYYTVWVHQIKTPIAVMRMILAENDTEDNRRLSAELFRVEQYVEMVLQYIRLGSDTNDLVIKEYSLDELIRQSVRKYASQFIGRKLKLQYETTDLKIVTDAKWFSCILEQILSNAVKYTPSGSVTISVTSDSRLMISDTGIGIAKEDLPRIFEKGYTGINGRENQKSSGLGLYLCKMAADKLSIPLSAESTPSKGSTFILDLHREP